MNAIINNLKQQIESSISLGHETPKGFQPCYCPVCKDYKKRAGFKFEDDRIIYNCFRGKCNASCGYQVGDYVTKKFKYLMKCLQVEIPLEAFTENNKAQSHVEDSLEEHRFKKHSYNEYQDNSINLENAVVSKSICNVRNVPYEHQHLFLQSNATQHVTIHCYFYNILIGVILYDIKYFSYQKKTNNSNIMFLPTGEIPDEPVITEGVFDAVSIPNGIAILGDHISPEQAYFLKNKNPIFLPDRGNFRMAEQAKEYNWRISIPLWKYKDPSEANQTMGLLNTTRYVFDNIYDDPSTAEIVMRFYSDN